MININLTTEEARIIGSWTRNIIKGLQGKLKDMPILKKKAEIILMENAQKNKSSTGTFLDFLTDFIDRADGVIQAEKFIKNYDEEVKKVEAEINSWTVMEEQIKTQIVQDEKKQNTDRKSSSSDPSSEPEAYRD